MASLGRRPGAAPLTTADIPDNSITAAKIVDATIAAGDLAANSVDSSELVDGSIDTSHIADNQVTLAKMAGGTDGQIITYDASGDPVAVGPGTDGQVLTSTGAGSPPAFEAVPAGSSFPTHVDIWRVTTNSARVDNIDPIVNWERTLTGSADYYDNIGAIGAAMTESSGIFVFPATGMWKITFSAMLNTGDPSGAANSRYIMCNIKISDDNGSSSRIMAEAAHQIYMHGTSGNYVQGVAFYNFDVKSISGGDQHQVSFEFNSENALVLQGNESQNLTYAIFERYGDT